jgi:N6-L-threonylcarbamoyladenine synthase
MLDSGDLNLSFSGLKTAVLTLVRKEPIGGQRKADVARAFEDAVVDVLVAKSIAAVDATGMRRLVVAGGVGANRTLRSTLTDSMRRAQVDLFFPPLEFCTDNGAMIALAGALRLQSASSANYAFTVRPRWELASLMAP